MTHKQKQTADVVICGAGIAGIAAAYHLSVSHGLKNIILVDERPPLSLTSDKSTECYRNWWPGPGDAMVSLMNRSIDLLEKLARQCGNRFLLNRRGYVYTTSNPARVEDFKRQAEESAALGAGQVRYHSGQAGQAAYIPAPAHGFENQPTGSDIILEQNLIRRHFPYLAKDIIAALHARRCGWFSGQQLGMEMLEQAQANGAKLIAGRVENVSLSGGQVTGIQINTSAGKQSIAAPCFVNAAGPFLQSVAQILGLQLPIFSELHLKLNFKDLMGVIPREAPMTISADPQRLVWSDEEREMLAESDKMRWMLNEFPIGVHMRPEGHEGSPTVLMLWAYHTEPVAPVFPPPIDPYYPEFALRGLARIIPGLQVYLNKMPKPFIDGGYYTKTRENRPLIGPLPIDGAYIIGALSGFGMMAAPASGELLAAHITGSAFPNYAPAFALSRYDDPRYQNLLANWGESGQL